MNICVLGEIIYRIHEAKIGGLQNEYSKRCRNCSYNRTPYGNETINIAVCCADSHKHDIE